MAFSIDRTLDEPLALSVVHEDVGRPVERVIDHAAGETARVPASDRPARHVLEHPSRPRVDVLLADAIAEQVVRVAGRDVAGGVGHLAEIPLDVEVEPRLEAFVHNGAVSLEAVVRLGQEGTAEHVQVGHPRRRCVYGRRPGGVWGSESHPSGGERVFVQKPAEHVAPIERCWWRMVSWYDEAWDGRL
jgi:hypothetical protein